MKKTRGVLLLTLTSFIWGTAFVAQSLGMETLDPLTFNAGRNFLAAAALCPLAVWLWRREKKAGRLAPNSRKTLLLGGALCGTALAAAMALQQIGIVSTTVGKAGFLTALYIVLVPIFGFFIGRRTPVTVWVSVAVAVVGTYLLSVTESFSVGFGDLLCILCAVGFTLHILLVDRFSPLVDGVALSAVQFFVAGVLSLIAALAVEAPSFAAVGESLGPLLYTGLLSSGVAYTLQVIAQKDTPPALASLVMSLESVFAALSGYLVLGQSLSGRELLGCGLVFAAVLLAQMPERGSAKG